MIHGTSQIPPLHARAVSLLHSAATPVSVLFLPDNEGALIMHLLTSMWSISWYQNVRSVREGTLPAPSEHFHTPSTQRDCVNN